MSYNACKQGTDAVFLCVACSCLLQLLHRVPPKMYSSCMYLSLWFLAGHSVSDYRGTSTLCQMQQLLSGMFQVH